MICLIKAVLFLGRALILWLLFNLCLGFFVFCCCAIALMVMTKFTPRLRKVRPNEG